MPNDQTNLLDLIKILRTGTPDQLGKAWRERYKKVYADPVKKFDDFIYSKESALPDLDDPTLIFDGKVL